MKNNFTSSEATSNEMFKYSLASGLLFISCVNYTKFGEEMKK